MKFFVVFFVAVYAELSSFAQTKTYTSFRDYFMVNSNPDSLEKAVYARKGDPVRYLHDLIWLEHSRYAVSDHFGNDLESVRILAAQQHFGLGTAMYHYLEGVRYKSTDFPRSLQHLQKALAYFENAKDTSGTAHCLFHLVNLNVNSFGEEIGDLAKAKMYFDQMVEWVEKSGFEGDKVNLMIRCLYFRKLFYPPLPFAEADRKYRYLFKLITKNPELRFVLTDWHLYYGVLCNEHKKYEATLKHYKLSLAACTNCSAYNLMPIHNNIAATYESLNQPDETEKYFLKVAAAANPAFHKNDMLLIEVYKNLATINIKNKRFDNILPFLQRYDSLLLDYNERTKLKELLNLQIKYETEKKETTIKALEQDKKQAEVRDRLIIGGLALSLLITGVIGFLALRLRRTNTQLQNLQLSRDKLYTIIAHDLREPLTSLTGVGTLLRYLIKHNRSEELETVTQQIDRMGQQTSLLLNNLLEWGKSNFFEQQSLFERFDAAPLLHELGQLYAALAESKGIELSVTVPEHFWVTANPRDLSLIVRNLLDNALKNTPKQGKTELIATAESVSASDSATTHKGHITVHNSGAGFSPPQLTHLQQVFAGKRKPQVGIQDLGLGLVLIHDFAKKNGFSVHLTGSEGQGATFTLGIG